MEFHHSTRFRPRNRPPTPPFSAGTVIISELGINLLPPSFPAVVGRWSCRSHFNLVSYGCPANSMEITDFPDLNLHGRCTSLAIKGTDATVANGAHTSRAPSLFRTGFVIATRPLPGSPSASRSLPSTARLIWLPTLSFYELLMQPLSALSCSLRGISVTQLLSSWIWPDHACNGP
jgi:hypothetical protein